MRPFAHLLLVAFAVTLWPAHPLAAEPTEDRLRAGWVGRWVVLRTPVRSNCDERFTNNRMRGPLPLSRGDHSFAPGEIGRVANLHLKRSRIDLLVELLEPLRVELGEGPFQLFEHAGCRVELELPAPRGAVREGDLAALEGLILAVVEGHSDRLSAAGSILASRRRVEPLPDDHEERWAAYRLWQQEQLTLALRRRLAEALDRAAAIVAGAAHGPPYARGMLAGAAEFDREPAADCPELAEIYFSPRRGEAPDGLAETAAREWRQGHEDGQRLAFELALAQRLERCLP